MSNGRDADHDRARRGFIGLGAAVGIAALAGARTARAGVNTVPDLSNLISVIDYGADPTGQSDSTEAIQTAINFAINPDYVPGAPLELPRLQGEAAVFFPSGRYYISDTLRIVSPDSTRTVNNISLIGMRAAIVQLTPGKDVIRFETTSHCMIKDLYLSGSSQTGNGITLIDSHRTVLENVEVYLVGGNCLRADLSFWLSAKDCIFSHPGAGLYAVHHLSQMNNVAYFHCRFTGSANSSTLTGNGLFIAEGIGTGVVSILACDFSLNDVALKIHQGANTHVANCYFEENRVGVQWGDRFATPPTWPMAGTIDNCNFSTRQPNASTVVHIDVQRGTNLRINNPVMTGNGGGDNGAGDTIGIRVHSSGVAGDNRLIVIDDVPYMQHISTPVEDPGRLLRRVTTQPY